MPEFDIGNLILWFIVFLFSLTIHESAHAWTSEKFGDTTGRYLGRITLNPIPHIDLFGTIIFPLIGQIFGGVMFGWAKPVPVNPLLWRDKVKANIMTSGAGPASNLLLAIIGLIAAKLLLSYGILTPGSSTADLADVLIPAAGQSSILIPIAKVISILIFLNIFLGIFNLVPIPPLDGSHILQAVMPYEQAAAYDQIRPYGFLLLVGMMALGVFRFVVKPFIDIALALLGSPLRLI